MSAQDFIAKLHQDPQIALEIHRELERLTAALVKKNLGRALGQFDGDVVNELVNHTFLIVYKNNDAGKPLDFSDPPTSLQSYFWRIADNLCKAFRRQNYANKNYDSLSEEDEEGNTKQFASPTENPEDLLLQSERDKIYPACQKKVLDELKENKVDQYQLLIAYSNNHGKTWQEMRQYREELAESLGITTQNLALKINRIREKLRERLKKCLIARGL